MTKRPKLMALLLIMLLFAGKATADDEILMLLKELKSEIKALKSQAEQANARISDLENQLEQSRNQQQAAAKQPAADKPTRTARASAAPASPPPAPAKDAAAGDKPAITVGDIKGTFKIPGTDTSVGVGGFVKTDLVFSSVGSDSDKSGDQQLIFSDIPVGNTRIADHSQINFIAKDSRLWFKSFTPSKWGDINTYIEFDFYGDASTYGLTPRLRHAYGSLGNLLAGQTWTTYLNVSAAADHIDVGNSAGAINKLRQPLIRWTQAFNWANTPMKLQAALEAPRSVLTLGSATAFTTINADRYPDLIARLNFNPEWGNISLAALGRQLRYTNQTSGQQTEVWGGGVNLAGRIDTVGLDNLRFMAHIGNGVGRYVTTSNTFEDGSLTAAGDIELVKTHGGMLTYQHWWNKQWRSNLTYGYSHADQPLFVNGSLNRQVQSVHANLLWSPITQAVMGVEYIYATREQVDGRCGDLQRVQFSARYNF